MTKSKYHRLGERVAIYQFARKEARNRGVGFVASFFVAAVSLGGIEAAYRVSKDIERVVEETVNRLQSPQPHLRKKWWLYVEPQEEPKPIEIPQAKPETIEWPPFWGVRKELGEDIA